MNRLKVDDGMNDKDIAYTDKLCKGIYRVTDNSDVIKNCEVLRIKVETPKSDREVVEVVSKMGDAGILTMRGISDYVQIIFTREAEQSDFDSLLKEIPHRGHDVYRRAYHASKRLMLDDEEGFLKMFGKK